MMNEQFISRNIHELTQVLLAYRELLDSASQMVLYMDKDSWEVFDPNVGRTIIRHDFKHLRDMTLDIKKFRQDLINVGCMFYRLSNNRQVKRQETWSYKSLQKKYSQQEIYRIYGKNYEIKDLADSY